MKDETKKPSRDLPPYLSLSGLDKLFGILSGRRLDEVTAEYLITYGFSRPDAYLALAALRFLDLVDDSGKAKEITKKLLLKGEPRTKAIEALVRTAYAKIFTKIEQPEQLGQDDLMNEFLHEYELSPRVARTAVPAFLWLCQQAGLRAESVTPRHNVRRTSNPTPKKAMARDSGEESGSAALNDVLLPFSGNIRLRIPWSGDITTALSSDEFREMSKAIESFAKLLPKHEKPLVNESE